MMDIGSSDEGIVEGPQKDSHLWFSPFSIMFHGKNEVLCAQFI